MVQLCKGYRRRYIKFLYPSLQFWAIRGSSSRGINQSTWMDSIVKEVLQGVAEADAETLWTIAEALKIRFAERARGKIFELRRFVLRYLNSEILESQEDGGLAEYQRARLILHGKSDPLSGIPFDQASDTYRISPKKSMGDDWDNMGGSFNPFKRSKSLNPFAPGMCSTPGVGLASPSAAKGDKSKSDLNPDEFDIMKKVFMREFKITGKLGRYGEKDCITYSSLLYQIDTGRKKGYGEADIINAVIKAATPDNYLRSYLESRPEMTIQELYVILRSHFREQDASTLFTTLGSEKQRAGESAYEFVMRLMSLRQKVKSVSATDQCPFEEEIIDRKFKTSVVSGIKNESIRSQLREVLKNPQVTDQDLLYNLTFIVTNETEHNQKFRPQQREVATSLVETKQERSNKLFDEFAALKLEVCQLRGYLAAQKEILEGKKDPGTKLQADSTSRKSRGRYCANCVLLINQGIDVRECDHCFACGSSDHYRAGCKQKN